MDAMRWERDRPIDNQMNRRSSETRAPNYEFGGREFESLRARQLNQYLTTISWIGADPQFAVRVHNRVHDRGALCSSLLHPLRRGIRQVATALSAARRRSVHDGPAVNARLLCDVRPSHTNPVGAWAYEHNLAKVGVEVRIPFARSDKINRLAVSYRELFVA